MSKRLQVSIILNFLISHLIQH